MLQIVLQILENINFVMLLIVVYSVFSMLNYLKNKGITTSRFVLFNPIILLEYPKHTKATNGKIGIWFWVFVFSSVLLLICGIAELLFSLLSNKSALGGKI